MKAHSFPALFALWLFSFAFDPGVYAQAVPATTAQSAEKRDGDKTATSTEEPKDAAPAVSETDSAVPEEKTVEKAGNAEPKSDEPTRKTIEETAPTVKKPHKIKSGKMIIAVDGNSQHSSGDRFRFMDDNEVPAEVLVKGNAVAVFGDLTVDGEVMRDAVAVFGDTVINGTVHHNAVAVMGDLTLGPKARVVGDVISVGGEIHRDPDAFVGGQVHVKAVDGNFDTLDNWWGKTLKLGRPLAIGAHLGWLWIVTGFSVAFYALLALIFPRAIRNCGDKLVQQPGLTILAAILGMLVLPVLFILLCVTVIGIPVALLLLPLGCILAVLFGKAAIYTLVGRKISRDQLHPALAAIAGALIFVVLYLVPIAGLLLSVLVSLTGFGCVILTLFAAKPNSAVAEAGVLQPILETSVAPPPVMRAADIPPVTSPVEAAATLPPPRLLPVLSATTLPRAGFWIRVAAALLDAILIGVLIGVFEAFFHAFGFRPGEGFPLWVVFYSVIMWATRSTTIGGVICGLRVVRLDDRPIDWGVAIVRALGGFLSLAVAGLGFIWVAFDDEKQSWHDKIAGTTIVRVPKGTSLL